MLSTAIIFFREVFEIVLIVGVVLAATRGLPGRTKWIYVGFGAGLAGSAMVAFFIGAISEFAEGMGQEIFNAMILFVASAFIGWTVLWIHKHGKEMKATFTKVGSDISDGKLPFYSLSVVIALAVLREGSEIVLFSYGMLAAGQPIISFISGAALGLTGGLLVGGLLYFGLVSISMKYFFRVTTTLLVLLVAGMMSHGIGLLVAVGYFESLSAIAWDSSWLLSDRGLIGESLNILVGYTARPAIIQLIVYFSTIGLLTMVMSASKKASISSK